MGEITTIQEIQALATGGFTDWKQYGEVSVRENGDLLIFNYTAEAQYAGRWNFFERVSRGLIIDRVSGEIVARPFDKFYNWLEGGRKSDGRIVSVTEKVDGSLGVLYRHNGLYAIATRGSFDGEQAAWATRFLNTSGYVLDGLPNEYTLLFEIVYPENRIVVDYGDRRDLVLLAVRNRFTGEYLNYSDVVEVALGFGFTLASAYRSTDLDDVMYRVSKLDDNREGYVVEFSDGQRFKFKGEKYLELHRLISSLSFKNTLAAVVSGTVNDIRAQVPSAFLAQFDGWVTEITSRVDSMVFAVGCAFVAAPKSDRKLFALWVQRQSPSLAPYLFYMYDGRDIKPLIYKRAFENRREEGATNGNPV